MLNLWFSHGSTTLPRALSVYRPIGEQLLYPYGGSKNGMLKSRSENAQGVLLSLSTLHLHRVKFDWESGAYRGLVDLRLSLPCHNATISASQLATILAANPAISILKIAHLRVTSPEDWIPPAPVVLDRLKVLNLANLPSSSLRLLLPLINLPSSPDELSVSLPISSDSQKELGIFLAGSQINTLYCLCSDSSGWPAVAKSLPCLDTLILHEFNMCDIPDAENDKPPQSTQYSQISSVVLLSSVVTFTGLERLLAEHGAPHLSLECCSARSETLHDLEAVRAALLELRPDLKFSISDTDSTSRLPCRTMFDH
ncbi:hypothetical protein FRC08_008349 [Ceratobasidium sp. 394]|nr:hypothetical protein FRC08_008349 [Ceratobasidium sp. 394]